MKVDFTCPTFIDQKNMDAAGLHVDLGQRIKAIVTDDEGHTACLFLLPDMVNRLGKSYIQDHATLHHSEYIGWYACISENDYYNDLQRNPEKVIPVSFVEIEEGTGREVYKGLDSGRYYLRDVSNQEPFAKWLICGKRRTADDGDEPRPNLIFEHNGQREKVFYDDWNGVCAYSKTFNPQFQTA